MPEEFVEAKLFALFGGWVGMQQTPLRVVQRHRIRIIAEMNKAGEDYLEQKRKMDEQERELAQQRMRGR